jgi:IS5 family transposase
MARRKIGQEEFPFAPREPSRRSLLEDLVGLINWAPLAAELDGIHSASKGEPAWPPLALFKALLIAVWYDLSDVKLAEALDDRASFRKFCGFSSCDVTPERTAFVRFRKELVAHGLDKTLFDAVTNERRVDAFASSPPWVSQDSLNGSASTIIFPNRAQVSSYGVRPRRVFSRRPKLYASMKSWRWPRSSSWLS